MKGKLKITMNLAPLKKLQRQSSKAFEKAMQRGAIQFLNWCNTGSKNESRKPPIKWGVLRGSSSAFVGGKLVRIFPQQITPGGKERPTPATSHGAIGLVITWVWNTIYAAKMHEWKGRWGKFTRQDMNAGNKWLEKHLQKDRNDLIKMISLEFGRETRMR